MRRRLISVVLGVLVGIILIGIVLTVISIPVSTHTAVFSADDGTTIAGPTVVTNDAPQR